MEKFLSRKFLMALLSVVVGVLTMINADDSLIQLISSLSLIVIPTLVYIGVEGKIDFERVANTAIEAYRKLKEFESSIEVIEEPTEELLTEEVFEDEA